MKKFLLSCIVALSFLPAFGQTVHAAGREAANVFTSTNQFTLGIFSGSVTTSQLAGLVGATNIVFVSDASATNPCTGGGSGAWAFYQGGQWNCGNFVSNGVADTTTTVGTTAIGPNTCTSATTVTMTGLTSTMAFSFSPNADITGVTGWGATGGLTIVAWPTTNTLNYKVCNQTGTSITPSSSVTFNVSAR